MMLSVNENTGPANNFDVQSVQTLIIGRLVVIFLLLVTGWAWYRGSLDFTLEELPRGPLLILIEAVGFTAVYFFLVRLSKALAWQVRAQFLLDAFLTTWLVYETGDLSSPYVTLYIVLISVSSLYLRPRPVLALSAVCALLFVLLSVLTSTEVIVSRGVSLPLSKAVQVASFHTIAMLVVGLLAARLSDRRYSGEQFKEAAKNLASLQALHERIIESIRSGLITTDLDGTIYTFNSAAAEITGYRAEEMVGKSIFSLFGDIRQAIDLSIEGAGHGEQVPRFEADLQTPEGFAVRVGYGVSQLFSEDNEASGLIITFQDLTEIRSMEESVRRKDRLAAVGRVGAGLAHEIRNPLGAMRGAIQVLESSMPANSVQSDLMGIILKESDRLNSIITNFLSYAKPKVGSFTEIDVNEAVRETMKLLRHSPDLKPEHTIEEAVPPAPVFIAADPTQLKQVFWNLSRNAINAMPEGGKLKVSVETRPNNRVRIVFEDTGHGMKQDQVERLFEPFARSTSGGTGLGLSIVYQIIRDHNGTINVRSFEGEGTIITIDLPRENLRRETTEEIAAPADEVPTRLADYLNVKGPGANVSS